MTLRSNTFQRASRSREPALVRFAGLTLAGIGVAHVVTPTAFTPLTRLAYARRLRLHTVVNGAMATTVGLGLAVPRTRALATVVGVAYGAHLTAAARTG